MESLLSAELSHTTQVNINKSHMIPQFIQEKTHLKMSIGSLRLNFKDYADNDTNKISIRNRFTGIKSSCLPDSEMNSITSKSECLKIFGIHTHTHI